MCADSTPALSITCVTKVARLASEYWKPAGILEWPSPGRSDPDQTILLRHSRHPPVPFHARFVVAVDEDGRFGLSPRFTQPVLSVEEIFLVVVLDAPQGRALSQDVLRRDFAGQSRDAECRRRPPAHLQQGPARNPSSHRDHLTPGKSATENPNSSGGMNGGDCIPAKNPRQPQLAADSRQPIAESSVVRVSFFQPDLRLQTSDSRSCEAGP